MRKTLRICLGLLVSIEYTNVTDRRTPRHSMGSAIVARQKYRSVYEQSVLYYVQVQWWRASSAPRRRVTVSSAKLFSSSTTFLTLHRVRVSYMCTVNFMWEAVRLMEGVTSFTHLGHIINSELSDQEEILHKRCTFIGQVNNVSIHPFI